jgi:hypothetical protein
MLATLLAVGAPSRVSASELEHQVKAEFMERFTRFIDWPEESFPTPDAPFVFCTVGADTLAITWSRWRRSARRGEGPSSAGA